MKSIRLSLLAAVLASGLLTCVVSPAAAVPKWGPGRPRASLGDTLSVTFSDEFDSLRAAWGFSFSDDNVDVGPGAGSAVTTNGYCALRPSPYRGGSSLYTRSSVVTTLPAQVRFRVRASAVSYRALSAYLVPELVTPDTSSYGILARLGTAQRNWLEPVHTYVVTPDGVASDGEALLHPVIPTDTWLYGSLALRADGVDTTFNGQTWHTTADIASIVGTAGLRFQFNSWDDHSRAGFDIDRVEVLQARPLAAKVRFIPSVLSLKSRGLPIEANVALPPGTSGRVVPSSVTLGFEGSILRPISSVSRWGVTRLRFSRGDLIRLLAGHSGVVRLSICGGLDTGQRFEGEGSITIR